MQKSLLDSEKAALKELEKQYAKALKEIQEKVKLFQVDIDLLDQALSQDGMDEATKAMLQSRKQSKIYQQQYQKALQDQVGSILNKMHGDNYATIDKYLHDCYEQGYVGTMYSLAQQGMPIIAPIDQAAEVKAILTDSKVSGSLYEALGVDTVKLKKAISQEISRGIATGMGYSSIARNISLVSNAPLSRTKTIARTEGHRIQEASSFDAAGAAKQRGVDLVKQWDASLDGSTRDSHRQVDGEIKELEEKFSNGLMYPGDPNGGAAEVVNCRCTMLTRARAALDESELEELKQRAAYFGLDKTENFKEFEEKYLKASKTLAITGNGGTIVSAQYPEYSRIIRPVDAVEDAKKTNPKFSGNAYEYTHNCQRCVPAWELRQRGFDVIAQPCKPLGEHDALQTSPFSLWNFNAFDKDVSKRVQADRVGTGKEKITEFLKASGDGSRVEIVVTWDYDLSKAHAFAAKNIDGNILFIDPQSGTSGQHVEDYFDRVAVGETRWLRIDNLLLAEQYRNEVIDNPYG